MIDISSLTNSPLFGWVILIVGLILLFIVLRYFLHVVVHIIRLFWKGCLGIVLIVVVWFILHYLNIL